MKVGILGDIHGNHLALDAALKAARKQGVEKLLLTGDLIGYYFAPAEVMKSLAEWECFTVRGNHEDMLTRVQSDPGYLAVVESRYGSGLRVAMEKLHDFQIATLCSLPHPLNLNFGGCSILLCHGAPWDVDQYIYPDAEEGLIERCLRTEYDLIVVGHTHYPMDRSFGTTRLMNPGSVGQPRNRQPGAHWAAFDTETHELEFFREDYDPTKLVQECRERHPEIPYLADVLTRR
jgi:putative phosphoesterase